MNSNSLRGAGLRNANGFTLIEVILAIFIATGILVTVMFFYQQAAELRVQLIEETERISTVRLLLDRMTTELRCAQSDYTMGFGFSGDATTLRFVAAGLPSQTDWESEEMGRARRPETDLRWITYSAVTRLEETNTLTAGFTRTEESLVEERQVDAGEDSLFLDDEGAAIIEEESLTEEEPLTEVIRFVRFRYWDGSSWLEAWDDVDPPKGIEISFGGEPLPEDLIPDEYPYELFRRVVCLPASLTGGDAVSISDFLDDMFLLEETP